MPDSKTIEIDEILPPDKASLGSTPPAGSGGFTSTGSNDPLAGFTKLRPWKVRLTLKLTAWFILLRRKNWGKCIIVPTIILALFLVIPLGFLALTWLFIRAIFFNANHVTR